MLDGLLRAALANRLVVVLLALATLALGAFAYRDLRVEAFPDPTDTQVNVITLVAGQSAEEMERQVSVPIERVLNGTPGLTRVRTVNQFGLSFATLTFDDQVDVFSARAQVLERLRLAALPQGVTPQLGSLSTPIGEIYRYTLKAKKPDPMRLRTLQDWYVRPKLLRVPGVADVVSYGGVMREIQVRPIPIALAANRVAIGDLADAIRSSSFNASGGVVEEGVEQLVIRSQGLFGSIAEIERIAVAERGGTPIYLSDVASVREGGAPRQGIVGRGKELDATQGIVLMRRGENASSVLRTLNDEVATLNLDLRDDGVEIVPFYDRTELVDATLGTVGRNLVEGAVLVVLVLFVFLLDLKAALIVAAVIPLALASAFIYLQSRGMGANLISMGAVDFGIIVDGAVVIIEAIVHTLSHAERGQPSSIRDRIEQAVRDVARPTVFSLLIIIAAYLPIFLLQRVEGRMFAPLAHTVVAALLGSLVFAVTLVPVLATFAYRKPITHRESPLLLGIARIYTPMLRGALRRPWLVLSLAAASLVSAGIVLDRRGSEFLPELNEGALYITFTLPANISLSEGAQLAPTLASALERFPEVESYLTQLGRPEDGTDPKLTNNLELFVKLRPMDSWPEGEKDLSTLMAKLSAAYAGVPGLSINFSQPIRDNVNENISGQVGQIALKIFGDDLATLQQTAEHVERVLEPVPGIADLAVVKSGEVPQLQVRPRREALGRFGLSMEDFQSFLSTALGGQVVNELWEGDRSFDVVLRLPESARDSVQEVAALRVPTPHGALVPLPVLADVGVRYGRAAIARENGQRYVGVRMNVRGRDLGTFVREAQHAVERGVPHAAGVRLEWGGEFESKERALGRLLLVVPLSLLATLVLLFNVFGSLSLAMLVLLNVPFALVGGALALYAADMPVSIAAAIGFIALVGQAALNGVLVLSAVEARRKQGVELETAIIEGTHERLRAVLMTAALAAIGLVPAALSHAMGAETQRPIAVVIVGGTVSAALLTLIVLPVGYLLMARAAAAWSRYAARPGRRALPVEP